MFKWVAALVSPIVDIFNGWNERKKAKQSAQAKLKQARIEGNYNLRLTDAEWEAISKHAEDDGWKDEWVTVVITLPLLTVFIAAVASVLLSDPVYMEAAKAGTKAVKELLPNFGTVLEVVVYAAVSIKGVKAVKG